MVIRLAFRSAHSQRAAGLRRLVSQIQDRVRGRDAEVSGLGRDAIAGARKVLILTPPGELASASFGAQLLERILRLPARIRVHEPGQVREEVLEHELVVALGELTSSALPGWSVRLPLLDGGGLGRAAVPLWCFAAAFEGRRFGAVDPLSLSHLPDFLQRVGEVPDDAIAAAAAELGRGFYALVDGPPSFAAESAAHLSMAGLPTVPLSGAPHHPLAHGRAAVLMLVDPTRPVGYLPLLRQLRARGVRLVVIRDRQQEEIGLLADVDLPVDFGPGPHLLLAADRVVHRIAELVGTDPSGAA